MPGAATTLPTPSSAEGDAERLKSRKDDGQRERVNIKPAAAAFTSPRQRPQRRQHDRCELKQQRRAHKGQDAQSEDRQAADAAAGERVERAEDAAGLLAEKLLPDRRIDPGNGNEGPKPKDQERADGQSDAPPQAR